jgi:hypothetical protein
MRLPVGWVCDPGSIRWSLDRPAFTEIMRDLHLNYCHLYYDVPTTKRQQRLGQNRLFEILFEPLYLAVTTWDSTRSISPSTDLLWWPLVVDVFPSADGIICHGRGHRLDRDGYRTQDIRIESDIPVDHAAPRYSVWSALWRWYLEPSLTIILTV